MRNLYVSKEALELKGKDYFINLTAEDYLEAPAYDFMECDGLLVSMDDMRNVYVQASEDDEVFTNVEDL